MTPTIIIPLTWFLAKTPYLGLKSLITALATTNHNRDVTQEPLGVLTCLLYTFLGLIVVFFAGYCVQIHHGKVVYSPSAPIAAVSAAN